MAAYTEPPQLSLQLLCNGREVWYLRGGIFHFFDECYFALLSVLQCCIRHALHVGHILIVGCSVHSSPLPLTVALSSRQEFPPTGGFLIILFYSVVCISPLMFSINKKALVVNFTTSHDIAQQICITILDNYSMTCINLLYNRKRQVTVVTPIPCSIPLLEFYYVFLAVTAPVVTATVNHQTQVDPVYSLLQGVHSQWSPLLWAPRLPYTSQWQKALGPPGSSPAQSNLHRMVIQRQSTHC